VAEEYYHRYFRFSTFTPLFPHPAKSPQTEFYERLFEEGKLLWTADCTRKSRKSILD